MRNILFVAVVITGAAACGARAPRPTFPVEYACGDAALVPHGNTLEVREPSASAGGVANASARLAWHDGEGDHYVSSVAPTEVETVEFVVPGDAKLDASARVYDTSAGTSRPDWRLVRNEVCTARGGYNDALARYSRGESLDHIAAELSLASRDDARDLVHAAMVSLTRRYYHDR